MVEQWWHPNKFQDKQPALALRRQTLAALRGWFANADIAEVDTPILQICPVIDAHIRAFATELRGLDGVVRERLYLQTSPEFDMKKLLAAGMPAIYQICPVFRNSEASPRHGAEFTMLEWARLGVDYRAIMQDVEQLVQYLASRLGVKELRHRGRAADPFQPWRYLRVVDAFAEYAGIELDHYLGDARAFKDAAAGLGLHVAEDDGWDDVFFRIMLAKIEPQLGDAVPCVLYEYPRALASLGRPCPNNPRYAERFELYVAGIELANCYSALNDATLMQEVYLQQMGIKQQRYGETYPMDHEFLAALDYLPPMAGIAMGVDRLVMLLADAPDIHAVRYCPPAFYA